MFSSHNISERNSVYTLSSILLSHPPVYAFKFNFVDFKKLFTGKRLLCQNVQSFNQSEKSFKTTKSKLNILLAGNLDVLLVTEVKLSDSKVISRIKNALSLSKNGPYELILNSGSPARGVGIIIKSSLFDSYTITY